ncbi:ATP-binding protein [Streptomyces sp. VRA16 Mangrove soil]|uniref:ATP-binding protein n=1 Tax=Streptomyces sp. VRA16 Mangrove soil TaxID=2817434 RepID=UPI001A9FCF82|nr:ATP-binding protein [Streptomyces sp. VRA16 Mangrove soil]MBO1330384.1 ATP-binding protein [Streptomyces sp. VRA16 Mangrove soil]
MSAPHSREVSALPDREAHRDASPALTPLNLTGAQARARVRAAVERCAAAHGLDAAPAVRLADAELVCSELVSNAFRHGGGLMWFQVRVEGREVAVEVGDASSAVPVSPERAGAEPGGFGWALVGKVTTRTAVGTLPDGRGKIITAWLPVC